MDSSHYPAGGEPPPRRQIQIQGTRPPPLNVSKDSHKIKKPPKPPAAHKQPLQASVPDDHRQPVIIYAVSPKVIHSTVSEFMTTVQRLTGLSSNEFSGDGDISPAARLAATEKASPRERSVCIGAGEQENVMSMIEDRGEELGQFPGILSPSPGMLAPVPAGLFSPGYYDTSKMSSIWQDLSPFCYGTSFLSSPSGLLSASVVSPSLSPDIFGQFWDF